MKRQVQSESMVKREKAGTGAAAEDDFHKVLSISSAVYMLSGTKWGYGDLR